MIKRIIFALGILPAFGSLEAAVTIEKGDSGWTLVRHGSPFEVRGLGGTEHLDLAREIGANTLRTWGVDTLERPVAGRPLLDVVHEAGFAMIVGIWLTHESSGIYRAGDPRREAQRASVRAAVRRYRDHPALLIWGLGNEMEGAGTAAFWEELELLARIVKEEDPSHPVMTVLAGAGLEKLRSLRTHCPSIDIVGINSYAPAALVPTALDETGWDRPFILTEFGPRGDWESPAAAWGAAIEPSCQERVVSYLSAHRSVLADSRRRCLGTVAFKWGHKQETTSTWFGMILPSGEKTPVVDHLAREFTGRWPANRSPWIRDIRTPLALDRVPPATAFEAEVRAVDPEGDTLSVEWEVFHETTDRRSGGAPERAPPRVEGCINAVGLRVTVRTPSAPGPYRLFVTVRDGKGGGCSQNIPFFVEGPPSPSPHR